MFSLLGGADFCLPWPATGSRPHVEPGARYPNVPTLVLIGELDFDAAMQRKVAALYPRAELVTFTGTGHTPMQWSQCARDLAVGFLQTRRLGDTRCASESTFDYPAVASFPRLAQQSAPAAGTRRNRAGSSSRRVARVAADTALDALKRSLLSFSENGPGLRGGTWQTDYAEAFTTTLNGARWTEDVVVTGTLHWSFDGGPFDADLQVDGPGRHDGTLQLEGGWLIPGAPRSITITGTLGGEHIAATVPST